MSDTVRLTEEFRGGLLDLTHYGYISIVDEKGKVIYSAGDPEAMVFYRSASKPVQALPVIAHHLDEKYGFTDEETVLFAGSHLGESFHVNALKSIMKKADLNPEDLIMKPTVPGSTEANEERIRQGLPKSKLYHNCSGKHAALMLTQREMGGDVKDYWKVGSVGQNEVLRTMSVLSEYPEEKVVIGIERNKPEAIDLMFSLVKNDPDYSVMPLQSRYPQGAEKVLIEKTTGREVPRGGLPADAGVIVLNVTTVSTLGKYLATGMPLTTKRLTVDGDAIGEAKNVEVVIGTPIGDVLDFCGVKDDVSKILMGGPMMGTAVADPAFPVLKQNNALVAFGPAAAALPAPGPCIRCGNCINACPMGLSPVEIAGAYTKNDGEMLDKLMVDLCIGCGTCSYVCPAKRPVTQTMNLAKAVWQKNKNGGKK